jgi:hypothetical protein
METANFPSAAAAKAKDSTQRAYGKSREPRETENFSG